MYESCGSASYGAWSCEHQCELLHKRGYTHMSCKDFCHILGRRPYTYTRACNTLSNEPISTIEGSRSSVQGIPQHVTLFDWPSRQYSKASSEATAVIELPIGKYAFGEVADSCVVLLRPAFLQANDVWTGFCNSNLAANFSEALVAEGRNVLETPAVQRQDSYACGLLWRSHGEKCPEELFDVCFEVLV